MPTSQQTADALLEIDRERRSLERVERELTESLAAIDRDYKAQAAPIIAALVKLKASRPIVVPPICGTCRKPIGFDWILGSRCDCSDAGAAPSDRFGAVPYSSADQVRNALLGAFEAMEESITTRAKLRRVLMLASDRTMEKARSLIK